MAGRVRSQLLSGVVSVQPFVERLGNCDPRVVVDEITDAIAELLCPPHESKRGVPGTRHVVWRCRSGLWRSWRPTRGTFVGKVPSPPSRLRLVRSGGARSPVSGPVRRKASAARSISLSVMASSPVPMTGSSCCCWFCHHTSSATTVPVSLPSRPYGRRHRTAAVALAGCPPAQQPPPNRHFLARNGAGNTTAILGTRHYRRSASGRLTH